MPENDSPNERRKVTTVVLTEGHLDTLDALAKADDRNRSSQLRVLIDAEAARRPDLAKPAAQAA